MLRSCSLALTLFFSFGWSPLSAEIAQKLALAREGKAAFYWEVDPAVRSKVEAHFSRNKQLVNPMSDFSRVFEAMTGVTPAQKGEGVPLRLVLLERGAEGSPLAGVDAPMREVAGELDVRPDGITITAETPHGLSNTLYYLLENWGCRWVVPGPLGEEIPKLAEPTLPLGKKIVHIGVDPAFTAHRPTAELLFQRNRLLRASWLPCFHFWFDGIKPKEYFESHPEYYALVDGERQPTQLETINPEVIALKIAAAKAFLRERPTARTYPMDPEDNGRFSEAPEAVAQDPDEKDSAGLPIMTDRVVRFGNAVLEGIREEFPDRSIGYYAYARHSQPPVNVKPDPATVIGVTRDGYCNLRLTPTESTPSPARFEELVSQWLKLTPNVYIYEYNPLPWAGSLPFPNYLDLAESMRRLHKMGVKGFYSDTPLGEFAPGIFINNYFRYRMMVDPTREPLELLADLCQSFFGPAAPAMQAYYETLAKVTQYNDPKRPTIGVAIFEIDPIFPRPLVQEASAHFAKALQTEGLEERHRRRLEWIKLGHDYLVNYLAGFDAARAGDYEGSKAAFEKTLRLAAMQERQSGGFLQMSDARRRLEAARSTVLAEKFPKEEGMLTHWSLLGPVPRNASTLEEEYQLLENVSPEAKTQIGEKSYQWKAYLAPDGILDFNRAFERRGVDHPVSKAWAATVVEAPEEMEADLFFGCFFPFTIYHNGKQIFERRHSNFNHPDANKVRVKLTKGRNLLTVLCKEGRVSTPENTGFHYTWGVSLALRDAEGRPLGLPHGPLVQE